MGGRLKAKWLRRLLESNVLAMGSWRADGRFTAANPAMLRLFGYTRKEARAGKILWQALAPPEYAPLIAQALKESQTNGECAPFEIEVLRKDGRRVPVLVGGAVLGEGVTDAGAFFAVDLSDRKSNKNGQKLKIQPEILTLSDRQRTICLLLSFGESEKAIARLLDLSVRTVELDKHRVAVQLGLPISKVVVWTVENRPSLIKSFHDSKLVPQAIADIVRHSCLS